MEALWMSRSDVVEKGESVVAVNEMTAMGGLALAFGSFRAGYLDYSGTVQ